MQNFKKPQSAGKAKEFDIVKDISEATVNYSDSNRFFLRKASVRKRCGCQPTHICSTVKVVLDATFLQLELSLALALQQPPRSLGLLRLCAGLQKNVNRQHR